MKKPLILIIVVVVIAVAIYALTTRTEDSGAIVTEVEGTITNIDLEQAMVDGPYIIVIKDEAGADQMIHVPSMGIQLCAAKDNIVSPSELSVGDAIEAAGLLTPDGILVPCESSEHYVRVND